MTDEEKEELTRQKWEARVEKLDKAEKNIKKTSEMMGLIGKALIFLITIPVVGLIFFGIKGLVIGILIGLIGLGSTDKK